MKYVPENNDDLLKLVDLYNEGHIDAESYYRAIDDYAKVLYGNGVSIQKAQVDLR